MYVAFADSKKDDLNLRILLPSDVVPSGNKMRLWPFNNSFRIILV